MKERRCGAAGILCIDRASSIPYNKYKKHHREKEDRALKRSTIINIAYFAITLSGIGILCYLYYIDIIPSTAYAGIFVALMIVLRSILMKKLS